MSQDFSSLISRASRVRLKIIKMIYEAGSGHSGGSLSAVEILCYLFDRELNFTKGSCHNHNRNRFILSKGHAAPVLYAVLSEYGLITEGELSSLRKFGSRLQGHPCRERLPGVELSTGSLGLGISAGVGMAIALGSESLSPKVFVLCGDGELNEGQNWEALMSAAKWNPRNLVIVVDRNHVQLDGTEDEVMPMGSLYEKIKSFGCNPISCDGHSFPDIARAFNDARESLTVPVIIAETVKGKGVSFMEGKNVWHGKKIEDFEFKDAVKELSEGGYREH